MEFKKVQSGEKSSLEEAAESALAQIEQKQYSRELCDQGVKKILCLGIAFKGKKVLILSNQR